MSVDHHFVIEPLAGVGPIRLGMHKEEVPGHGTIIHPAVVTT